MKMKVLFENIIIYEYKKSWDLFIYMNCKIIYVYN